MVYLDNGLEKNELVWKRADRLDFVWILWV
jgi:hypothetical protein